MLLESIEILIVEDDMGDVELIKESLKMSKFKMVLNHVSDGQECMEYLTKQGPFKQVKKPDVVLLDLNLPKKDGRQVLAEMKTDPGLKKIPVVILTTSDNEVDINKAYALGANCFVTKPVDFGQIKKIVNEIAEFWFTVVKLPAGK